MTDPTPDLSRLRINRDTPTRGPGRAFRSTLLMAACAVVLVVVALFIVRGRDGAVPVQVATATVNGAGGAPGNTVTGRFALESSSIHAA